MIWLWIYLGGMIIELIHTSWYWRRRSDIGNVAHIVASLLWPFALVLALSLFVAAGVTRALRPTPTEGARNEGK